MKFDQWAALAATAMLACNAYAVQPQKVQPRDLGPAAAETPQTVSIVLKLQHPQQLDEYISATVNPRSPLYHRFVTVAEFKALFAPTDLQVRIVTDYMRSKGITINEIYADNLLIKATGTVAQFNAVFATSLHDYQDGKGQHYRSPHGPWSIPHLLDEVVLMVAGLSTESSSYTPKLRHADVNGQALASRTKPAFPLVNGAASDVPGDYTVGDVAARYNVTPLYAHGFTGKGRTLGIATLANFQPADAYSYWDMIGLKVLPNRITQVHVDGGGPLSSIDGTGETSLDVEQSGGLAPFAKIVVYDAPNTEAGFIDVFYKAASDNLVDTLSTSWGGAEITDFPTLFSTDTHLDPVAYHQAFAEAAAQGISLFAAAGDDGAYDIGSSIYAGDPYNQGPFNAPLTVDNPASDPYIVAAGGTTLPATLTLKHGTVTIPTERIWAWDYLNNYLFAEYGIPNYEFSTGGGGGVSFLFPTPEYQTAVSGIRRTEPNQSWIYYPNWLDANGNVTGDLSSPQLQFTVPGNYAGRNVPDISLNADPYTGYFYIATVDGGFEDGYGGTSFVAPQLNGIFSLLSQASGSRLGLVNPQLYQTLAERGYSHGGPLNDITTGTDWFYKGKPGYEPGAGLGTIDAAALLSVFR